jgi:2'-5' RNA ligase
MIRAFIAAKIDCTPLLRRIVGQLTRMGRAVKAVGPDSLHVTVKFFGDIEPDAVVDISRVLIESAALVDPCTARIVGLGAFPRAERPSVVWAALENAGSLVRLAELLESRLRPLGFTAERRAFHPHVTLARIKMKPPDDMFAMLSEHASTDFGTAVIDAVELLQSELGPDGPKYTTLERAMFGA